MAKARRSKGGRKLRTPEQIAAVTAREIGMPEAQIARGGLVEEPVVDLASRRAIGKTVRILYPTQVDRWLAEGGEGFDEPQKRAIQHVRELWYCSGNVGRLVANLDGVGGGCSSYERGWSQIEALAQMAEYEREIPKAYWLPFEAIVRHDVPASRAGAHLGRARVQQASAARVVVGFVASKIAEWRGF
jgi:hypothetical protein